MALTRPTFNNINTSNVQAFFNDPQVTLNYGNVAANNQDIGFVLNRGTSGNVAVVWQESSKGFALVHTTSSGLTAANVVVAANANLRVGNLGVIGVSTVGSIIGTDLTLSGNLTVNGTATTINSITVVTNDKTIVVANNQSTSATVDGAGIDAGGSTPIATWRYNNATTSWQSNVGLTPAVSNTLSLGSSGNYWNNVYATTHTGTTGAFAGTVAAAMINAATIGNTGALLTGTLQTASQPNITGVGTITTGTWNATTISTAKGGTGLTAFTSGGALYATSTSALTTGTLPVASGGTGVTTSTGSGSVVLSASPTFTGTLVAATINAASIGNTGATLVGSTANVSGNATVVGNITIGNVLAGGYFYANGAAFAGGGSGTPGGSNTQIQYNNNGLFGGATGLTTNGSNLTSTGTIAAVAVNAATIGNTGALLTGTLQTASQPNITGVGTLTGLTLSGALTGTAVNAATIGNSGALLTGTLQTASQPNITGVGTITTGTWNANLGTVSAANLTNVPAGQLTGTIPSAVLGNSTHYIGTTAITLNRASATQTLTGVSIDGSASAATTATNLSGFTNSNSTAPVAADQQTQNGIAYVNANIALFGQTDGALHTQAYSSAWLHQIYGDYRTGQIAIRGKNNGTWQAWRTVWDSSSLTNLNQLTNGPGYTTNTGTVTSVAAGSYLTGGTITATGTLAVDATSANTASKVVARDASGNFSAGTITATLSGAATSATTATNLSGGSVSATSGTFSTTLGVTTSISRNSRNVPTYVAAASAPASPLQGDFWYETGTDILHQYIFDGTSSFWVDISSALVNSSASATAGTLALRDANADLYATVFRGKATSAQYADLAENYSADAEYPPGTVVVFGGDSEITVTNNSHDHRVAGVISTNPAYLMNSESSGLPVAFTGRVPCLVHGTVAKGDLLVTSEIPGVATALDKTQYVPGCVIGKSLEDKTANEVATIEVVVGRF